MKSTVAKVAGLAVATSSAVLFAGGASASAATTNGAVTLVAGNNAGSVPVVAGLSDTPYGIQLAPSPAANGTVNNRANCSADSATGSTYVYTYLIPANENVATDNFAGGEPGVLASGATALALFQANGTIETQPSTTQQTAPSTGQISLPPQYSFSFGAITNPNGGGVSVSTLTGTNGGNWIGGYVCVKNGSTVTDNWQFPVTFTATATGPNNSQGFSWAIGTSGPPPSTPEVPLPILLPLGAAGLVAGGVLFARRRRPSSQAAA